MINRRTFLSTSFGGGAGLVLAPILPALALSACNKKSPARAAPVAKTSAKYRLPFLAGMGGAPLGNGLKAISDAEAVNAVAGAWDAGVRYFDTSPLYGYGLSERRMGEFLDEKPRPEFVISTKVGRLFKADKKVEKSNEWFFPAPFKYTYDFTAAGVRRSIEDSLLRLNIESIDIALVHDLEPTNPELGPNWLESFEVARTGAFVELSKMRSEGLIKSWGLGVNRPEPILMTMDVADPDIMLVASQYSIIEHEETLNKVYPACLARGVSVINGTPLNSGFVTGAETWNWAPVAPEGAKEKRAKMNVIAKRYKIDLRTAALQFCAAHPAVVSVIPGAHHAWQTKENYESMKISIPADFWKELKADKLIAENAPVPDEGGVM